MTKVLEVNVDDNGHGGVYAFILNVLENIGASYQLDLCTFEKFDKQSNVDYIESFGGKVHYCGSKSNFIIKQIECLKALYHLVKNEQYDAIHIHSDVAYKLVLYAGIAKFARASRILIHSHSAGVDGNHRGIKQFLHTIARTLTPFVANSYLACTQKAAEWMYPQSILKGRRFSLINNGINTGKFTFDSMLRSEIREELGIHNDFVVGHVGRFCYQKNHAFLISIFNEVIKRVPNAKLLLIGSYVVDDSYWNQTKAQVEELGLKQHVIFLGVRDDVASLMQAMDAFVLPSRFEGLGIVGIEAQAAGLPSFFSDNIPRDVAITDLSHFIPLENSPSDWAEKIVKERQLVRSDRQEEIVQSGYDITKEVEKLRLFYSGE